ncbi:regulator of chromosome condensation 1/beta-lactamase-inhibitor protein II [Cladochytrium replicatum]|nr:regulator of chromosome condensation 1/beta-lactamase-inhibitor protein II [Cladochytrium replicatum]
MLVRISTSFHPSFSFPPQHPNAQSITLTFTPTPSQSYSGLSGIDANWSTIVAWSSNRLFIAGYTYGLSEETSWTELNIRERVDGIERVVLCKSDGGVLGYLMDARAVVRSMLIHEKDVELRDPLVDGDGVTLQAKTVAVSMTTVALLDHNGKIFTAPIGEKRATKLQYPRKLSKLCAGFSHFLSIDERGDVVSWGNGLHGQLGHGTREVSSDPRPIDALSGLRVIGIACGGLHSTVLLEGGILYTFGSSSDGQLGRRDEKDEDGEEVNYAVPGLCALEFEPDDEVEVLGGWYETVVAKRNKGKCEIYACGRAVMGLDVALRDDRATVGAQWKRIRDPEGREIWEDPVLVAAGGGHVVFLTKPSSTNGS